ncbi:hypothetical protein GJAV_G00199640 [Gymnothorax javanicus]|nr:hypothetical protein GJAV_G00199640 [Gymnothorax javanicus]
MQDLRDRIYSARARYAFGRPTDPFLTVGTILFYAAWSTFVLDLTCLTTEVLKRICGLSMRNYRLIFCHNLKQP